MNRMESSSTIKQTCNPSDQVNKENAAQQVSIFRRILNIIVSLFPSLSKLADWLSPPLTSRTQEPENTTRHVNSPQDELQRNLLDAHTTVVKTNVNRTVDCTPNLLKVDVRFYLGEFQKNLGQADEHPTVVNIETKINGIEEAFFHSYGFKAAHRLIIIMNNKDADVINLLDKLAENIKHPAEDVVKFNQQLWDKRIVEIRLYGHDKSKEVKDWQTKNRPITL